MDLVTIGGKRYRITGAQKKFKHRLSCPNCGRRNDIDDLDFLHIEGDLFKLHRLRTMEAWIVRCKCGMLFFVREKGDYEYYRYVPVEVVE